MRVLLVAAVVIAATIAWIAFVRMPGRSFRGKPATMEPRALRDAIERDVRVLAGDIGERNVILADAYRRAATHIEDELRRAGYEPTRQTFSVEGVACANIEAELKGSSNEMVVIGAHYDSVDGAPGADDNGSGVAAMLALARTFARTRPQRTIRFVAFANEEPPYFQTASMGSYVYAQRCKERRERVAAMISLETIGYFSDAPHSQQYPALLERVFPTTANFIAFASNLRSQALLRTCIGVFRKHASIPSEGAALPEDVPGIGWSDQWSFWQAGYPAVMVTDTALFRNPHYHQASDRPETLDYDRLARVVEGLVPVVSTLANADR